MAMTLLQLSERIDASLRGSGAATVEGCAGLEEAGPEHVSFLANRRYAKSVAGTKAAAVIVSPDAVGDTPPELTLLVAKDPYFAFRNAVVALHGFRQHPPPGISPQAYVDGTAEIGDLCTIRPFAYVAPRARIGKRVVIYPHCYVGKDAVIGDDCILFPNVTIYDRCVLGNRVTLHAGCVIGQDGFGYATHAQTGEPPMHHKIPQVGNVVLEDDVEMGACCTIDRATLGSTRIGAGTKFSDLIAIGHGSNIGKHNLLVAQVGIAGSTQTGDYVVMGGQAGVAGHLKIGDQARIAAKAGVMTDVPAREEWGGEPARPMAEAKRAVLASLKLPDFMGEFRRVQREVQSLQERIRKLEGEQVPPEKPEK